MYGYVTRARMVETGDLSGGMKKIRLSLPLF
jgi:hypothetical protein